jgi:hypothetical protein
MAIGNESSAGGEEIERNVSNGKLKSGCLKEAYNVVA